MAHTELDKLKSKIEKDSRQSEFRIKQIQSEIQEKVSLRKELRVQWEQQDQELEGDISECVQEISEIQGRLLQAQDIIKDLESLTV